MTEYRLFVPGIARTSGSHDSYQGRIVHAGKYTKSWMDKISWFFLEKYGRPCLLRGPVYFQPIFYLPRPKGHYGIGKNAGKLKPSAPKEHITKPDLTKLIRAAEDALTKLAWNDDAQNIRISGEKYYEDDVNTAGVLLYIKGE